MNNASPLIVDLDGTLVHTDLLYENLISALKEKLYLCFCIPFWLLKGKAYLKKKLAETAQSDVELLPYNFVLIEWLKEQKLTGRKLVLCTASDLSIATDVAEHLGFFDEVMASDGQLNLAGPHKAKALVEKFGAREFAYAGNSRVDLDVWRFAKEAIVVSGSNGLVESAKQITKVLHIVSRESGPSFAWIRAMRLHQWVKNCLLFIPVLAAHRYFSSEITFDLLGAFISFGLCASSVYILNDLADLDSDRRHLRKKRRPFASGQVPIWQGLILAPTLLFLSLVIAVGITGNFLAWLILYFAVTVLYSLYLKKIVLIDCFSLAFLYTLRILAGASVGVVELSFWLLAFSIFIFLSLALLKRYAEIQAHFNQGLSQISGRGYRTSDASLIQQLGISAGYCSAIVLSLYLSGDIVVKLYGAPLLLWGTVPCLLLWISWMWLKAERGQMHDDPIIFALKDKASVLLGIVLASFFILATFLKGAS